MITLQTADNALKSFYLDAVKESIDLKANPLLAEIQKTSKDVYGKDVRKTFRLGFNGGVGTGTETGDLPTASTNDYGVMVATLKNLYGTLEISDKALRAAQGGEGAFVDILNDEMQSLIKSASFNLGRMLYGNGSGLLARVVTSTNVSVTVDSVRNLAEGMRVYFTTGDLEPISTLTGKKIIGIDRSALKIYFSSSDMTEISAAGLSAGMGIMLQPTSGNDILGLEAIFSTNALYGVDRSNGIMKPYSLNSASVDETIIQKAIDTIEENSGGKVNFIVCSMGVKRAIAKYFKENNIMLPTMQLNSGYHAMSFNGIPIVADRFCPSGTMYLLNTEDFKLHQLCDWEWLEGEDGKVLKQVPGKPVYTATLVKYAELICERPCGQGKIYSITEA